MWSQEAASDTLWGAHRNMACEAYEEALADLEQLLQPAPGAYEFFQGFQLSYVRLGLKQLAEVYPPARAVLEKWEQENRAMIDEIEGRAAD